jgi:hypothetical protein
MRKLALVIAVSAVALSFVAFALTFVGIAAREWHWSKALATLSSLLAVVALFLVCLCFRDQATRRKVHLAFGLLAATAALFAVFPQNEAAF